MSEPTPSRLDRRRLLSALAGGAAIAPGVASAAQTPGGPARPLSPTPTEPSNPQIRMGETYASAESWGVSEDAGASENCLRLQRALDEAPMGAKLYFPRGVLRFDGGLVMRRQLDLVGQSGTILASISSKASEPAFDFAISENALGLGDTRFLRVDGVRFARFAGSGDTVRIGVGSGSASALKFQFVGGGFAASDDQGGHALRVQGITSQAHIFQGMEIENGVLLDGCADGCRFIYNSVYGVRTGFTTRLAEGAFRTLIAHNIIVARDGAWLNLAGSQVDFLYNQVEHAPGYGDNNSPLKAHVAFQPSDYAIQRCNIIGNNFGGGPKLATAICLKGGPSRQSHVSAIHDTFIDGNTFYPCASGHDVVITDDRVRSTRVGTGNHVRGARGGATFKTYPEMNDNLLDAGDLLSVLDAGVGTYGVWKDATALDLAQGWSGENLRFRKGLDDVVSWEGDFVAGPAAPEGVIGRLPDGFRPALAGRQVVSAGDGGVVVVQISSSGEIILGSPATAISAQGLTYRAKGRSTYQPGA